MPANTKPKPVSPRTKPDNPLDKSSFTCDDIVEVVTELPSTNAVSRHETPSAKLRRKLRWEAMVQQLSQNEAVDSVKPVAMDLGTGLVESQSHVRGDESDTGDKRLVIDEGPEISDGEKALVIDISSDSLTEEVEQLSTPGPCAEDTEATTAKPGINEESTLLSQPVADSNAAEPASLSDNPKGLIDLTTASAGLAMDEEETKSGRLIMFLVLDLLGAIASFVVGQFANP